LTWTTLIAPVIVSPFAVAFVYAAVHEVKRLRKEGRVEDWRERFDFDEEAPSYEPPQDDTETDTETEQQTANTVPATEEATDRKDWQ